MSRRMVGRTPRRVAVVVTLAVAAVAMTLGLTQAEFTDGPASERGPVAASGPTRSPDGCVAVGAAANAPERVDTGKLPLFRKALEDLGPLTVRRSFDTGLPRSFDVSAAAGDADLGVRSFTSWKPPNNDHRGAAEGAYDRQITAWAESVPRTGVHATSWHEPEDDMTGPEFVAFQRHVYTVVKAANPTIQWGPVYMAYWWDPEAPGHFVGDPDDWWPGDGYADFAALDWYGPDPRPMTSSSTFRFWYEAMEPTGVPLLITEYGQYAVAPGERRRPGEDQARVDAIREDAAWIAEHPRITMWLYWQGVGAQGDWRLRDEASQRAWREVAESGCPRE